MTFIEEKIQQARDLKKPWYDSKVLFVEHHDIDYDRWVEQKRVKTMWFETWMCTDTWVGGSIMWFDEIPFALIYQDCRKCTEHVFIFNVHCAERVRKYMRTMLEDDIEMDGYNIVGFDSTREQIAGVISPHKDLK
jgi:hypothetical protein